MNLVHIHLSQLCKHRELSLYDYYERIVKHHRKIIVKHCKCVDLGDVYYSHCIKELPLNASYVKLLPECSRPSEARRYNQNCIACWIKVLQENYKSLDYVVELPKFLKSKEPLKTKPTSLLKKKELPKFLK